MKLDAYDKKILERLLGNSREQVSTLSKKIRLRRENTNYRIGRLLNQGIIRDFNTIFNEELLGLDHYVMFLQLTNLNKEREDKIIKNLKSDPYITWIGISAGKYSMVFDLIVPNNKELDSVIKNILNKLKNFIDNYVVLKIHEAEYYDFKILELEQIKKAKKEQKKVKLDKIDWKIIELLNKTSRVSYVDIAEKTKLTPNAINNRVKNLENKGLIHKYTISLNWKKFGYEWYGLQFKTSKFDSETEKKIITYLKENPKVIFYYKYIGGQWDYDIGVIVKDSNEFRDFINDFRSNFPKEIKITDIFLTLDQLTAYKLPKGVFSNHSPK